MRRAAKTDDNQSEVVRQLKRLGATVSSTHQVGEGFPDLVVGYRGVNYLIEVKDGKKVKSQKRLRPKQIEFHEKWRGQIMVLEHIDDFLNIINDKK